MNRSWKRAMAALLVLVLVVPLCLSCDEEEEGVVTITIGEITDLTGPASPAIIPLHWALADMVSHYNEKGLIPGVKFKVVSWDNKYDPSRDIPGYEWVRERGAKLIICVIPQTAVILKTSADRDEFAIAALSTNQEMLDPPGWVFAFSNSHYSLMKTFLKWVYEEDWDYTAEGRVPKFGMTGWSEPATLQHDIALREYALDHPDQIEYVGGFIAPFGQIGWGGEVEKLKDCDYVEAMGFPMGPFMKEFQMRGYSARFFDIGTASSYRGFLVDQLGYEALDGTLAPNMSLMWNEETAIVDLAKELLYRYHPGDADEAIYAGLAYVGGMHQLVAIFHLIEQAIAEVGAENFNSQAFYDVAVEYKTGGPMWEGYPEWGFSETKRYLADHVAIYKFDAEVEDLVWVGGWLDLLLE